MPKTEFGEQVKQYIVTEIAAPGFGNQDAKISRKKSYEKGTLNAEMEARMHELITLGECMVRADEYDDGCFDGRPSELVTYVDDEGDLKTNPISYDDGTQHARQKLAGGGYITGLAMKRGVEPAQGTIEEDLASTVDDLSGQNIHCGVHTGSQGNEENCDCGANHHIKSILENGVLYGKEISAEVQKLLSVAGLPFSESTMSSVFSGWASTVNQPGYFEGSTSTSRISVILKRLHLAQKTLGAMRPFAVSKHLKGEHREVAKVVNYVEGDTFSQPLYLQKMHESFPDVPIDELPQVFALDAPRIIQIAQAKAANYPPELQEDKKRAFLYAGVAYQSATEATLTDGTMRTYVVTA